MQTEENLNMSIIKKICMFQNCNKKDCQFYHLTQTNGLCLFYLQQRCKYDEHSCQKKHDITIFHQLCSTNKDLIAFKKQQLNHKENRDIFAFQKPQMTYQEQTSQIEPERRKQWELIQKQLREKVIETDSFVLQEVKLVAGVDITFDKFDPDIACASIVVVDYKTLYNSLCLYGYFRVNIPYVPGFLGFRECDPIVEIYKHLIQNYPQFKPDVIIVDGNGILHTRQCGFASHLGVTLDIPTIGVSKTMFYIDGIGSEYLEDVTAGLRPKETVNLVGKSKKIWGTAIIPCKNSYPLIINIGHRISLQSAVKIVKSCCIYKVVEPVRQADKLTRKMIVAKNKTFGEIFKIDYQLE